MDETTTHLFSSAKANKWTQFVIWCIQAAAAADVFNGKEKEANRRTYRFTTQIHVSLRLGKKHWHTSNIPCTYIQACNYSPSISVSHSSTWSKALNFYLFMVQMVHTVITPDLQSKDKSL
jgi:hypothetical protein